LKVAAVHVIVRRDSGREFQMEDPSETQNAFSPNLVLVLGTMKSVVSAERSQIQIVYANIEMLFVCSFEYSGYVSSSV